MGAVSAVAWIDTRSGQHLAAIKSSQYLLNHSWQHLATYSCTIAAIKYYTSYKKMHPSYSLCYIESVFKSKQHVPHVQLLAVCFLNHYSWWAGDNHKNGPRHLHRPNCCFFTPRCYLHHICRLPIGLQTTAPATFLRTHISHEPPEVMCPAPV